MTRARIGMLVAALLALRVGVDLSALLAEPARYLSEEEGYNAAVAWVVVHAGLWSDLFALQYRSFCGGCTVVTVASVPLLAAFGDVLLAWKSLALAWTAATGLAGYLAVDRHLGRFAALSFLVLWAVPSPGLTDVLLMLWGNHTESALLVFAALALVDRPLACGLVCGATFWFCRTSAYAIAPILLAILVTRRDPRVLLGLGLGSLLFLLPYADGDDGIFPARTVAAVDLRDAAARLVTLLDPRELAHRMFPGDWHATERTAGVLVVAAVAELALLARRKWLFATLAPSFALAFAFAGYANMPAGPGVPVMNLRYHGPWFLLLALTTAAGAGVIATRSRLAGVVLVAVPVMAFGVARIQALEGWKADSAVTRLPASCLGYFAVVANPRLGDATLDAVETTHPVALTVVGRLRGAHLAKAVGAGTISIAQAVEATHAGPGMFAALASLGASLAVCRMGFPETNGLLATLGEDDARMLGRGMATVLGMPPAMRMPPPEGRDASPATTATAMATAGTVTAASGAAVGAPCLLCSAAGRPVMQICRGQGRDASTDGVARCLFAATADLPSRDEVLYGAGVAFPRPDRDPALAGVVSADLAALDASAAAAFTAGLADPLAGIEHADASGCPGGGLRRGPGGPRP